MESLAYLARQPILDRDGRIFAYELLFRDSPTSDTAIIASDVLATAQVIAAAAMRLRKRKHPIQNSFLRTAPPLRNSIT